MGSGTGVRQERQEVSSTDSPRVKGSIPVRGSFLFAEIIWSNTILADLPELSTLGKTRIYFFWFTLFPLTSEDVNVV